MALHGSRRTVLLAVAALAMALGAAAPAPALALAPDLSVSLTVSPDPGVAGSPIVETATVTNVGGTPAPGVQLAFLHLQPITASSYPGCTQFPPLVLCPVGSLAPGASATRQVVFASLSPGTLEVTVSANMDVTDPTNENNAAGASIVINQRPDLQLHLSSSPEMPVVGDDITISAAINNAGAGPAPNSVFQLVLLPGVTVVSMPSGCAASTEKVVCALGLLDVGASTARSIVLHGFAEGDHALLGSVSSSVEDIAAASDRAEVGLSLAPRPPEKMPTAKAALNSLAAGLPRYVGGCLTGRTMRLRLLPQATPISAVSIFVAGKRVRRITGERLAGFVNLRDLPPNGFTIRINDELTDGRRLFGVRRIEPCARKRK